MSDMSNDSLLLPRLLIGLEALREQQERRLFYPYPGPLCIAWNYLTLRWLAARRVSYPTSLSGLLALCAQPVEDWFPAELPPEFPPDARLLQVGGGIELTGYASRYLTNSILHNGDIHDLANAAQVERALQNNLFSHARERLQNSRDPERAQAEYVLLRRFLIANPFTTRDDIARVFSMTSLKAHEVGAFYRDCDPSETYHCCPNCGPLFREHGRWRGAKPDVCSDHLDNEGGNLNPIPFQEKLCHVRAAIHERVCLHGIEEIRWLDAVHQQRSTRPKGIATIEDWPGIDTYDLRITFSDETVWAADMKDYRDPEQLARGLQPFGPMPDTLRYDIAFYVVPDRREVRNRGYCRRVRAGAILPENHRIVTSSEFLRAIETQITRRKRKESI